MSEWRNIETAPKDGRSIKVAWRPNGVDEHKHMVTWWVGPVTRGHWMGHWTPTHWQPLLEQPK